MKIRPHELGSKGKSIRFYRGKMQGRVLHGYGLFDRVVEFALPKLRDIISSDQVQNGLKDLAGKAIDYGLDRVNSSLAQHKPAKKGVLAKEASADAPMSRSKFLKQLDKGFRH